MDLQNQFADEKLENEGVPFPLGDGAMITLAREGNDAYMDLMQKKVNSSRAILDQNDSLARKTSDTIVNEVYAATIIKGWSGINLGGADFPFNRENALILMRDRNIRKRIMDYAQSATNFRKQLEDDAVKN